MSLAAWLRPPRRTLTLFVCLMAALAMALGWLAWQVLEGDRKLERSQRQERLEQAADRVAATLERNVGVLNRLATSGAAADRATVPDDVVIVRSGAAGLTTMPAGRLVFLPEGPPDANDPQAALAEAERAEFQRGDPLAASALYAPLARTTAPPVHAAALVGLGRCLRKAGRTAGALEAYATLATLGDVKIAGRPAELAALEGRCTLLAAMGRTRELEREADRLNTGLWSGKWGLSRSAWEFQLDQARAWGARHEPDADQRRAATLSAAADWALRRIDDDTQPSGVVSQLVGNEPMLAAWSTDAGVRTVVVAGPVNKRAIWPLATASQRVEGTLTASGRQVLLGTAPARDAPRAVRSAEAKGLPWSLTIVSADPLADQALFESRRWLLLTTFGVLALVLVAASFFILRSIQRERDVAKLQSDFVSAVSHEFRTPLTSLGQLSEMLSKGRVPTDALKQESYEILARETDRLRRLVESILDFGRMEAGSYQYQLAVLDSAMLVRDVVADVEPGAAAAGFSIEVTTPIEPLPVNADRDALALALRNLLENAIKYSGTSRAVWIESGRRGERVEIAVRDRGVGIPESEQREVYRKFVRGTSARQAGIPGTGIGLTIARQIVAAHHGQIRLHSEPGVGSTFTIDLPVSV